jgi:CubicO group peptidase (beta-lactamase class C family)
MRTTDSTRIDAAVAAVPVEFGAGSMMTLDSPARRPIAERMESLRVPGVSIAVIRDGEIEAVRAYGVLEHGKSGRVSPDSVFQACSISKHVTAVGILRMVQEGCLDLDQQVDRYLKSWHIPSNDGWQPRITVRQLLSHTAGLVYFWCRGFEVGEPVPTLGDILDGRPPAITPPVRVVLPPGAVFRYSGAHYDVLQQLVIDVTGQPFEQAMARLVLEPVGMQNTSFDQGFPTRRASSAAVGHHFGRQPITGGWRVIPEMAAGGMWSTPGDLARLAIDLANARRGRSALLGKELVDEAMRGQAGDEYGLGIELEGAEPYRRWGHAGGNVGYACLSLSYCDHDLGAVVMTNTGEPWLVRELFRAIADAYEWPDFNLAPTAPRANPGLPAAALAGDYALRPDFTISIRPGAAGLIMTLPGQPPIDLLPLGENRFACGGLATEVRFEHRSDAMFLHLLVAGEETSWRGRYEAARADRICEDAAGSLV